MALATPYPPQPTTKCATLVHLPLPTDFLLSSKSMKCCGNSPSTAQNHFIPASASHRSLRTNTNEARLDVANVQDNSDNYNHRASLLLAHKPPTLLSFMVSAKQVSVKQPVNEVCCLSPSAHIWVQLCHSTQAVCGRSSFKIWCSQPWEGSGGMTKGRKTKEMSDLEVA